MASYDHIRRFKVLIDLLKYRPGISKDEILDRLQNGHDINISDRTLERDLAKLRADFYIDVYYDRIRNGYFINQESQNEFENFKKLFDQVFLTELLKLELVEIESSLEKFKNKDDSNKDIFRHLLEVLLAMKKDYSALNTIDYNFFNNHYRYSNLEIKTEINTKIHHQFIEKTFPDLNANQLSKVEIIKEFLQDVLEN